MSHIVDSLRNQKKLIVLGAALAIVSLYIIPVDQIVSAITPPPGLLNAVDHIDDIRARILANDNIPSEHQDRIDAHLAAVQDRLIAHHYRILGL